MPTPQMIEQAFVEYICTHMGPRMLMGPYMDWWVWVEQEWWDWVPVGDTYGWRHGWTWRGECVASVMFYRGASMYRVCMEICV